jgi:hypothetical protein
MALATQEIRNILWKLKAHYLVQMSLPLILILSQMNPVHSLTSYFFALHLTLFSHLYPGLPSGLFPSGFLKSNMHFDDAGSLIAYICLQAHKL